MKQLELPLKTNFIPTEMELEFLEYLRLCPIGTVYSMIKQFDDSVYAASNSSKEFKL